MIQRRARDPDRSGFADRGGITLAWEEFRPAEWSGAPSVVLLPSWQIVDSRFWKLQIAYLARHARVVTFDGRGTGRSSRPTRAAAYANPECAADIIAVMDATGIERALLVGLSCGATWAVHAAAGWPDRVSGLLAISPACGFGIPQERDRHPFDVRVTERDGWAMYNRYFWLEDDFGEFRRFFFERMCSEPHSTKQFEDFLQWSAETDPALLADATSGRLGLQGVSCPPLEPLCRQVRCPVTVVHGTDDRVRPLPIAQRLAELTGGSLITVQGGGHALPAREPVLVNRLIGDMLSLPGDVTRAAHDGGRGGRRSSWVRAPLRPRRVLFLSSPIGLGHARRDIAIAAELRRQRPDVEVAWLAQDPVTRALQAAGQAIHPASRWLLGESAHIESECGEHDLNAFQAIRRMDETLVANFMVFCEVVESEYFDLVIGDEAWEADHFLHENPELKRFGFAWLTDFVGWLPLEDSDDRERALTADLNAEMLEHRSRFGPVRDRSIFVGNPDDVVQDEFGPGLPSINSWVRDNFDFAGYVTGFDPAGLQDPQRARARWGCGPDERLAVVTVGGSGVGEHLLRRVLDAVPVIRERVPDLRFLAVAGPRIDPSRLPHPDGTTVVGFVPQLHRELAACDVAVVQGGLTTCMELTAARTPFVYVPLRHHFEQNIHVRRRLRQYRAGRHLPYENAADPDLLAAAVIAEQQVTPGYRPVETDGASRVATMLSELL